MKILKKGVKETTNHIELFKKIHRKVRTWPDNDDRNEQRAVASGLLDLVRKRSSQVDPKLRRAATRRIGHQTDAFDILPKFQERPKRGMSTALYYFNSFEDYVEAGEMRHNIQDLEPNKQRFFIGIPKYVKYLLERLDFYKTYLGEAEEAFVKDGRGKLEPQQQAEPQAAAEPQAQEDALDQVADDSDIPDSWK